eukprot:g60144.t1
MDFSCYEDSDQKKCLLASFSVLSLLHHNLLVVQCTKQNEAVLCCNNHSVYLMSTINIENLREAKYCRRIVLNYVVFGEDVKY